MDLRRTAHMRDRWREVRSALGDTLHFRSRGDPAMAEARARECLRTRAGDERIVALVALESWAHMRFLGRRGWAVTWAALSDVLLSELEDQLTSAGDHDEVEALQRMLDAVRQRRQRWRLDEPTEALVRATRDAITQP